MNLFFLTFGNVKKSWNRGTEQMVNGFYSFPNGLEEFLFDELGFMTENVPACPGSCLAIEILIDHPPLHPLARFPLC